MNGTTNVLMKKHLADTLKGLSREKSLEKISVGDIVKAGHVNRSTFYYHFKDKNDLIQYIYEDDVIRWYAPSEQVGNWIPNTEKRLQMLKEDTPFYLQTLNIRGDNNFQTVFFQTGYDMLRRFIDFYLSGRELDETSKDFIAAFYANASVAMSVAYMKEGAGEEPRKAALRIFDITEPVYRHDGCHYCGVFLYAGFQCPVQCDARILECGKPAGNELAS